jgi:hypothetical protein
LNFYYSVDISSLDEDGDEDFEELKTCVSSSSWSRLTLSSILAPVVVVVVVVVVRLQGPKPLNPLKKQLLLTTCAYSLDHLRLTVLFFVLFYLYSVEILSSDDKKTAHSLTRSKVPKPSQKNRVVDEECMPICLFTLPFVWFLFYLYSGDELSDDEETVAVRATLQSWG